MVVMLLDHLGEDSQELPITQTRAPLLLSSPSCSQQRWADLLKAVLCQFHHAPPSMGQVISGHGANEGVQLDAGREDAVDHSFKTRTT